ncbi:unnamed protein product, partial [Prorocentrum cordatum]
MRGEPVSDTVARAKWVRWKDLQWVVDEYEAFKAAVSGIVEWELWSLCDSEHQWDSLGVKVRRGCETWSQTAMRHCIYPAGGSCTEHTDYGIVTLQLCSSPGFEAYIRGSWRQVSPT